MFFKPLIAAAALVASGSSAAPVADAVRPFHADRPAIELTDAQKSTLEQAKALRDAGDHEGAHTLMETAGFPARGPGRHGAPANLTDAQKAAMEKARALHEAGDIEGAKKIIEGAGLPGRGLKAGFEEGRGMGMMKFRSAAK